VRIERVAFDHPASVELRQAQRDELEIRYESPDSEPGIAPTAADVTAFYVAFSDDGEPIACGGLRELDATHGEVKRMYAAPGARGTGVAAAVLATLEQDAAARGWTRLLLETGDRQPDAIRFYTREGYAPIPSFGHYAGVEASRCFEKLLIAADPALDTVCEGCE